MTIRFIAYSVSSMNALADGQTENEALSRAAFYNKGNNEFTVIAETKSNKNLSDLDVLTHNILIVWRGSNSLAQKFRNKQYDTN